MLPPELETRRKNCEPALDELRTAVGQLDGVRQLGDDLCIYVTGSYGRLEASQNSDLDVFFVAKSETLSHIDCTLMYADLIRLMRERQLPEFSNEGEYLHVHNLATLKNNIGSNRDDYDNTFTARMLLLLEGRHLYNEALHMEALNSVVNAYYVDYHDHTEGFRPVFLLNDILRFWRTLTLNYEKKRSESRDDKNKHHLKNLKLKFSRMMTCYSAVAGLAKQPQLDPGGVRDMLMKPPVDRLLGVGNSDDVDRLLGLYDKFLKITGHPKEEVLKWIGDKTNRGTAFRDASDFGALFFKIIKDASDETTLQYLVV